MSVSSEQSALIRLERDLIDIDRKIGEKEKKEADLFKKVSDAQKSAARSTSISSATSYLRQADQYQSQIVSVKSDKVRLFSDKSRKQDEARRCKERLAREEGYEHQRAETAKRSEQQRAAMVAKAAESKAKRQRDADEALRRQEAEERNALRAELAALRGRHEGEGDDPLSVTATHDFFISHASEDKQEFVRALAEALQAAGHDVWYDEFALRVGDNLRLSIERGITNSKFGVVVLSPAFFRKEWTQRELDALFALDTAAAPRILPIWHGVSIDQVAAASPILAGRVALKTAIHTMDEIVRQLGERVN